MVRKRAKEVFDWIKIFVIAIVIAVLVRMFLFSPIIVDGPSMQPTLYDRDQMLVNKFIYMFKEPERFDIVIFHASDEKDFIKRVIGLPGEHVKIVDNDLYINGELVEQRFLDKGEETSVIYPIITTDFTLETLPGNYEVIPDNHVLVLGDNGSNSTDSRSLGLIEMDQIVGKTNFIYWPFDRIQIVKN